MFRHRYRLAIVAVHCLSLACGASLAFRTAAADDSVRYFEKDGITYRETRTRIERTIPQTQIQESQRTVYRQRWKTELQNTVRNYYVPVTEYRWESEWRGRFNPFVQPSLVQRLVPHTRWELRSEVVQTPVVRPEIVPEVERVQTPVVTYRAVPEEITRTVAVGVAPSAPTGDAAATVARRDVTGGVQALDDNPPAVGSTWRPSGAIRR